MRSVYLGQFTDTTANAIAAKLEAAGIAWSYKQAGRFSRMFFAGDWGTRMFVESERLDEARRLAAEVEAEAETEGTEA